MPSKTITGSSKLSTLGFQAIFDLVNGLLKVNLSPTVWLSTGNTTVLGAKLIITAPSGDIVSTGATYSFTPPMSATASFNLPTVGDTFEWGTYMFRLTLTESTGVFQVIEGAFNLCNPSDEILSNVGVARFHMEPNCEDGVMSVFGGDGYPYKDVSAVAWEKHVQFFFPQVTGLEPLDLVLPSQVELYTGLNTVTGYSIGTFDFTGDYRVLVKFVGSLERKVRCANICDLYCAYDELFKQLTAHSCHDSEYKILQQRLDEANRYWPIIQLGIRCGKNVDSYLQLVEEILDIDCACNEQSHSIGGDCPKVTSIIYEVV